MACVVGLTLGTGTRGRKNVQTERFRCRNTVRGIRFDKERTVSVMVEPKLIAWYTQRLLHLTQGYQARNHRRKALHESRSKVYRHDVSRPLEFQLYISRMVVMPVERSVSRFDGYRASTCSIMTEIVEVHLGPKTTFWSFTLAVSIQSIAKYSSSPKSVMR